MLGSGGIAPYILDLSTRWPRESAPATHFIKVGSRAGLDIEVKRKILNPCQDSNP